MVGGIVIEVADRPGRPDVLYVDCLDNCSKQTCAVLVKRTPESEKIQFGDSLWWQDRWAMWSPADGSAHDVRIPRVGYSGVKHPFRDDEAS